MPNHCVEPVVIKHRVTRYVHRYRLLAAKPVTTEKIWSPLSVDDVADILGQELPRRLNIDDQIGRLRRGIPKANVLMVADLTRLGRSTADLADIVTVLGGRGIGFRSLAEPWLDTTSAHGRLIFDMFASLAEYERSRLSERTKAGLAAAKARGRLGGRPRTMTDWKLETARQLRSEGHTLKETAQRLSVSVSSLTRALNQRDVLQVRSARP